MFTLLIKFIDSEILFGDDDTVADPLAVWYEVRDVFGIDLPVEHENRINAILASIANDAFTKSRTAFRAIVLGIARGDIDSLIDNEDDDVSIQEIAITLATIGTFIGDNLEMSEDVKKFIMEEIMEEAADADAPQAEDYLEEIIKDFAHVDMPEDLIAEFAQDWCNAESFDHVA